MKKIISILLLLCIIFSACQKTPNPTLPSDLDSTADIPVDIIEDPSVDQSTQDNNYTETTQTPLIAVSMPATNLYTTNENGDIVFQYSYQNMYLTNQDPEVADKIILDYLRRVDQTHVLSEQIAQQATSLTGTIIEPYSFRILYNPTRIDQSVLSLFGMQVSYAGGVHPEQNCTAANYDMLTGDVLTLGSILYNVSSIEPLYELVIDHLSKIEDTSYLMSDYKNIVKQRLFSDESHYEDWYFTSNGLCFFFPPYEIAPYTSGIITIEIPYTELTGVIGDDFFPPERDLYDGTISVIRYQEAAPDKFSQITEVTLDAEGEMFFLYTDSLIYDVSVDVGTWNNNGTEFTPIYTAFSTNRLTVGDAVMVRTDIPDTLPTLRLTYRSGAETAHLYVAQSGENGSVFLTE